MKKGKLKIYSNYDTLKVDKMNEGVTNFNDKSCVNKYLQMEKYNKDSETLYYLKLLQRVNNIY